MSEADSTGKINNALLLKTKMLEEEIEPLRKMKLEAKSEENPEESQKEKAIE